MLPINKQKVNGLWEELLTDELYITISLAERSSIPYVSRTLEEKRICVDGTNESYFWDIFGISSGGGWRIDGRLEDEISLNNGLLLQVYLKHTWKKFPLFFLLDITFYVRDHSNYPIREVLLVTRDPDRSPYNTIFKLIRTMPVSQEDILVHANGADGLSGPPASKNQRRCADEPCYGAKLSYDAAQKMAIITLSGVKRPMRFEVPIPQKPEGK